MSETSVPVVPQQPGDDISRLDGAHDDLAIPEDQRQREIEQIMRQLDAPDPLAQAPEQLHIAIGSVEDVRAVARDAADARLARETQGGGFRGLVRRIWKGNVAREYYQQKYQQEAESEIQESGNLFVHQGADRAESDEAMNSLVQRMTHKHADELISAGAGESLTSLDDPEDERSQAVRSSIFSLIDQYSTGALDEDNFEEEKNRVLSELSEQHPELFGEGMLFADNLLEIAQNVKAMVRHDRGVADILQNARLDVGKLASGVRTEARFTKTDEVIRKLQETKVGSLFNETTVTTAASIIASVGKFTIQKGVAKAAAVTGVLGAGGAIIAGMRESKHIREDRRQHARERAMGEAFRPDAKRRQELEDTRYESVSAQDLTSQLDALFGDRDDEGLRKIRDLTQQGYFEAAALVAQVRVRNRLSDNESVDLIHFSSAEDVANERFQLLLSTIYAESALEQYLEEQGGIDWLREGGLNEEVDSYDRLVELNELATEAEIRESMSEKDAIFQKVHRNHVIRAAVIGGTVGMVIGASAQEAIAHMPGIGNNLYGLGEGKPPAGGRSTLLSGAWGRASDLLNIDSRSSAETINLGGNVKFDPSDGFVPKQGPNGEWFVQDSNSGDRIDLTYDEKGLLTQDAQSRLTDAGFKIDSILDTPKLSGVNEEFKLGNNTFIFPEEYNVEELSPGNWNITDQQGEIVHALKLNLDGSMTPESVAELKGAGIGVVDSTELIESRSTITGVGGSDLVQNHLAETKQVHRVLWYGNDTPSPKFDQNELRTHAGGLNGGWFDAQGNVVLDVSAMNPDGSYWGDQSVNPFLATGEGRLSLAVSATKDTQANVFDFSFSTTPDGRTVATIPPDSPVHQMFQMQGDKRVFNGAYFEVMEHTGVVDGKGEQVKILGTYVGENSGSFNDTVLTTQEVHTTRLDIQPAPEQVQVISYENNLVEAPPVVPLYARRGLETPMQKLPNEQPQGEDRLPVPQDVPPNEPPRRISSNEVELWRGGKPVKFEQYKRRGTEWTNGRSDRPSAQAIPLGPVDATQETFKLNGSEYSRQEMIAYIQDYLGNLQQDGPLMNLLQDPEITSPDAFVDAVQRQLDSINDEYDQFSNKKSSRLQVAARRFFPDNGIFASGRIIAFDQADARGGRERLSIKNDVARDVLKLMFMTAKNKS